MQHPFPARGANLAPHYTRPLHHAVCRKGPRAHSVRPRVESAACGNRHGTYLLHSLPNLHQPPH
eukprot:1979587-Prorocentrum_lima.AAC.1